jgi:SAM-dependent methyltransferase
MELNRVTLRNPAVLIRLAWKKIIRILRREPAPAITGRRGTSDEPFVDVSELIASSSIEELNQSAEAYFRNLTSWDFHLAKPFSSTEEAPQLLINFATALQCLQLVPGMRVVDFGAGTGWTSRFINQLGCRPVVVDVSATALEMSRELFARHPPVGDQPDPQFLLFDGRRIDLPDASVDRILCFDAFHHAPNPQQILAEFARILVPGGIAAFSEPGPEHSRSPQSQDEMRRFRVIENDVDVDAIWTMAQSAGFRDIRLAAYFVPAFHTTLRGYQELLRGGETYLRWAELTRAFLHDVRTFFLIREGEERPDSRRASGLLAEIEVELEAMGRSGEPLPVRATVRNRGSAAWLPSMSGPGGVSLGCHLYRSGGEVVNLDFHWEAIDRQQIVGPGEVREISFFLPPLEAGEWVVEFDCVADRVTWFGRTGSPTVKRSIELFATEERDGQPE